MATRPIDTARGADCFLAHARSCSEAAHAYDVAGARYAAYADGHSALSNFSGRYAFADREVWARIDAALVGLRAAGRHALRVLDLGCGPGTWLLRTVQRARDLGFTAIEGRGVDIASEMIALARARPVPQDPAIGISFENCDLLDALACEDDHAVDLTLCLYGVLNHLPAHRHAAVAAEIARVTDATLIVTARAAGSPPSIFVAGIEEAASFHQDNVRDRLAIELRDGQRIEFDSHLFRAQELKYLFARHCMVGELAGLDLFHSRFAPLPHWNPVDPDEQAFAAGLARLEHFCASDPALIDHASHILLVAHPLARLAPLPSHPRERDPV